MAVVLRIAGCRPEVHEAIGDVVGFLREPVLPGPEGQREPIEKFVVELAEYRFVLLYRRVGLRPELIVRPRARNGVIDRSRHQTIGVGRRNVELGMRLRVESTDSAAEVVYRIEGDADFLRELVVKMLAVPEIGLAR